MFHLVQRWLRTKRRIVGAAVAGILAVAASVWFVLPASAAAEHVYLSNDDGYLNIDVEGTRDNDGTVYFSGELLNYDVSDDNGVTFSLRFYNANGDLLADPDQARWYIRRQANEYFNDSRNLPATWVTIHFCSWRFKPLDGVSLPSAPGGESEPPQTT